MEIKWCYVHNEEKKQVVTIYTPLLLPHDLAPCADALRRTHDGIAGTISSRRHFPINNLYIFDFNRIVHALMHNSYIKT
jgi:hypothetical protein